MTFIIVRCWRYPSDDIETTHYDERGCRDIFDILKRQMDCYSHYEVSLCENWWDKPITRWRWIRSRDEYKSSLEQPSIKPCYILRYPNGGNFVAFTAFIREPFRCPVNWNNAHIFTELSEAREYNQSQGNIFDIYTIYPTLTQLAGHQTLESM